ncbi:LLM class flavin-dependent oxidoreductase, partial [Staphylococcus simulans]
MQHVGPVPTNYDPFLFLTYLSANTNKIALGTASIVATLRHPIHVAQAAATLDLVSHESFLMGLAPGDRSSSFPAFNGEETAWPNHFGVVVSFLNALCKNHFPNILNSFFNFFQDSFLPVFPFLL